MGDSSKFLEYVFKLLFVLATLFVLYMAITKGVRVFGG